MRIKTGLFLPLGAVAALLLFPLGGVVADTFISGHRMFIDRVDDRGVSDGEILKYDGDVNQWVPAADDTGVGGIATNDTASAVLIGTGSGWAQETDAKIDSSGNLTTTGNLITTAGYVQVNRNGDAADAILLITGDAGEKRGLILRTTTDIRWKVHVSDTAESGSNAGSHFDIERFTDAGTYIDTPFRINRDTGLTNIGAGLALTGALSVNGDSYIYDDKYLAFGSGADIQFEYVTGTPDRLRLGDGTDAFLTVEDAGATGVFVLTGTLTTSGLLTATTGVTIPDDQTLTMGDVTIVYDEATDDRLEIAGAVDISGAATLGSTLGITGVTTLTGGAKVPDDTTIAFGDLVTPDATIQYDEDGDNDLQITGNTSVVGTFGVSGATTLSDNLTVAPTKTITAASGAFAVTGVGATTVLSLSSSGGSFTVSQAGVVTATGLPTSDPAVAGQLWVDESAGFVIKVSQGE